MQKRRVILIVVFLLACGLFGAGSSEAEVSSDSLGLEFAAIEPGAFTMGADLSADYITAWKVTHTSSFREVFIFQTHHE